MRAAPSSNTVNQPAAGALWGCRTNEGVNMIPATIKRILCGAAFAASLAACGGSGSSGGASSATSQPVTASQSGSVPLLFSDASTEDWATIAVKVLSVSLTPQGGGSPVTVFTAPTPAPMMNLAQLDQLGEILGNVSVPVGTYTSATVTISANPGDVALVVAADPEAGFAAAPGASIDQSLIQIQHPRGTAPNLTVPVNVSFQAPLVVTTARNNALDLEFDLGHPAFIIGHTPPGAGQTLWAVNFEGPVRRHDVGDIARLVLRHLYGTVTAVAADASSITVTKDFPALPATSPETPVTTSQSVQILCDATNGTIFYDVDAKTSTTVKSFSTESASLTGKYVRVASRYQEDGTLVAVRVWASSQFNSVWVSPEGHVLHVDPTNAVVSVTSESGGSVPITVNSATEFFFRTPQDGLADATAIATGTQFLTNQDLVRGFKVHVSVVDPLATTLVAQTVDIETATYDGRISGASPTGFSYARNFRTTTDDYNVTLDYISGTSPNGKDSSGNPVTGFQWWDFTYPTLATTGSNAIADFVAATNGGVNFGGTAGSVTAWGASYATWNDPANPSGWSVPEVVISPTPLPLGIVAAGYAATSFTMNVAGGTTAATVDLSTTSGSATLVYQVDRTNGVVTVSPIDVTTSAGVTSITNGLVAGAPVKVYGVPQADGTLKAYVILYYTGDMPAS
jgi:hypothetical protein